MTEAPYRGGAGGPIEIEIDLGGKMKRTRYHLDADVLRIEPLDGAVPPEQVALAEVTRVELATLAGTTICTLHLGDNRKASAARA